MFCASNDFKRKVFCLSNDFIGKVFRASNDFGSGGEYSSQNPSKCRPFCSGIPSITLSFSTKRAHPINLGD